MVETVFATLASMTDGLLTFLLADSTLPRASVIGSTLGAFAVIWVANKIKA